MLGSFWSSSVFSMHRLSYRLAASRLSTARETLWSRRPSRTRRRGRGVAAGSLSADALRPLPIYEPAVNSLQMPWPLIIYQFIMHLLRVICLLCDRPRPPFSLLFIWQKSCSCGSRGRGLVRDTQPIVFSVFASDGDLRRIDPGTA